MIDKISSYLGQWFASGDSSSMPSATPPSPMYTSSLSSLASSNKGKGVIAGLVVLVGLIVLAWQKGWNPIQKFFGKSEATKNETKVDEFKVEDWITCPVAQGTRTATEQGFYTAPSGKQVNLCSGEQLYKQSFRFSNTMDVSSIERKFASTEVVVVKGDCLEVAEKEQRMDNKVAVLVFASPVEPGGAMAEGNNGQEEDICRRSNLFDLMWKLLYNSDRFSELYPLVDLNHAAEVDPSYSQKKFNGMFLTSAVTVFRAGKDKNYAFLEKPFDVGMLISPALRKPQLTDQNTYLRKEDQEQIEKVIITQLRASHEKNYDTVILGAFGCGAFQNPPALIAQLYKDIIEKHFQGAFKKLIFPILDNTPKEKHNPEGNLRPFQECFGIH
jgi:uncharacterized protein (TIGR02452 family)